MQRDEIRQVLNIPDRPFVDYAIGLANLRPKESTAVQLREMDDLTIFEAAEAMNVSETMIKAYHRSGFRKLDQCWSSRPWIDAARREYFPPQLYRTPFISRRKAAFFMPKIRPSAFFRFSSQRLNL